MAEVPMIAAMIYVADPHYFAAHADSLRR